jgi:hypothetical protein
MSYSELLHDKRIVRRNIDKGLLTKEQLKTKLGGLRDLEGRYEYLLVEEAEESADGGDAAEETAQQGQ